MLSLHFPAGHPKQGAGATVVMRACANTVAPIVTSTPSLNSTFAGARRTTTVVATPSSAVFRVPVADPCATATSTASVMTVERMVNVQSFWKTVEYFVPSNPISSVKRPAGQLLQPTDSLAPASTSPYFPLSHVWHAVRSSSDVSTSSVLACHPLGQFEQLGLFFSGVNWPGAQSIHSSSDARLYFPGSHALSQANCAGALALGHTSHSPFE